MKKVSVKKQWDKFAKQTLNKQQQQSLKGGEDFIVSEELIIN